MFYTATQRGQSLDSLDRQGPVPAVSSPLGSMVLISVLQEADGSNPLMSQ